MHPALSVIVFTVCSGAGFGLLTLMGLASLQGVAPSFWFLFVAFGLGFALSVGGLVSSTFHLGHPERAWRALSQWRTSWLSREGILAIAALAVNGLYALLWTFFAMPLWPLGLVGAALALLTVWATGMIYAQIKAVRLWHRILTPVCYLIFSLASGALVFLALHGLFAGTAGPFVSSVAMVALVVAWAAKLWWWYRGDRIPALSTTETATGLGRIGRTRLLEPPHTGSNYLLREMGFRIARKHASKLRWIALILGAVLPVALVLVALALPLHGFWLVLAVAVHLAGMLVERWLFFAEAQHAVMTFYRS